MVFSSITFLLYFLPVVIAGYYLLSFSRMMQNMWLLIMSLFFYAWGEPVFVLLMMGSIFINWSMGLLLDITQGKLKIRRMILVFACVFNLGLLGVFKYTNFVADTFNSIMGRGEIIKLPDIALPIGISFFTFQALSYVIDVYWEDVKAQKNLFYLGLYISFFPQLVAGPIVRYNSISEQIYNRKNSWTLIAEGVSRFVQGLIKKVFIANNMAVVADNIFDLSKAGADIKSMPMLLAWIGAFAYTCQLYYDFSSYSDMAIGLGKMFGFTFEENFNYPFISKSIREFMARWHISLGTWFNQYVYRPLGGSRVINQDIMIRNLFVVWLLTGIWHGAAFTFVWWGLYFFLLIVLEKIIMLEKWEGHSILKHIYTVIAVIFAMVIFRSEDMNQFSQMIQNMFALNHNGFFSPTAIMFLKEYGIVFLAAIVCALPVSQYIDTKVKNVSLPVRCVGTVGYIVTLSAFLFFSVVILAKGGYNPFIYFNF